MAKKKTAKTNKVLKTSVFYFSTRLPGWIRDRSKDEPTDGLTDKDLYNNMSATKIRNISCIFNKAGYTATPVTSMYAGVRDVGQGHAGHAMACPVVWTLKLSGHQSFHKKKKKEGRRKKKEEEKEEGKRQKRKKEKKRRKRKKEGREKKEKNADKVIEKVRQTDRDRQTEAEE